MPEQLDRCDGCGKLWSPQDVKNIRDLWERVQSGDIVPSGECPECDSLCYPLGEREFSILRMDEAKTLLELLDGRRPPKSEEEIRAVATLRKDVATTYRALAEAALRGADEISKAEAGKEAK